MQSRILLIDIETSPNVGYTWGKWEQNVIEFISQTQIICFAYKWHDEKYTTIRALPDYPHYRANKIDDRALVKELHELLDAADVVIAHNGDSFDIKVINSRFVVHKLKPPSPYKTVDTKKVAKRYFRFNSNKLGDLGPYLGEGDKKDTGGFDLWLGCMAGNAAAWRKMKQYNKQDVVLLEKVYIRLRPWMVNHPNLNLTENTVTHCTSCTSPRVIKRGFRYTSTARVQQYQCTDCGAWMSGGSTSIKNILR